jgi:phage gp16-like protein
VEGIKRLLNTYGDHGERRRRAELAKIHILAQQARLDRETYEAMLQRVANVTTSAALDAFGRRVVIEHLKRCAGESPRDGGAHRAEAPHNLNAKPLLAKIEALLADGGKPWAYADALARRICHKDRLAFCSDAELHKIVAALAYDQQRRARREVSARDA